MKDMKQVIKFLKDYIWDNGFEELSENPFSLYLTMVKDTYGIEPKTARLVLVTLMSKTHEMAKNGCSIDEITSHIQSEHCLNKKTANELASLYLELFNEENTKTWDDAREAGFAEFCEKEWTVEWSGQCEWHAKRGMRFPCSAEATLTFRVEDAEMLHDHLAAKLKSNPFLSADDIYDILETEIEAGLDTDMEDYCNEDDYYEPYLDDFVSEGTYDSEEDWKSWGLEIIEFTGSGNIDFEP